MSQRGCLYSQNQTAELGAGAGGWGWGRTVASYTHFVLLQPNFYIWCSIRSSHHLNLHILVVHLFGKDGDMFFCVE